MSEYRDRLQVVLRNNDEKMYVDTMSIERKEYISRVIMTGASVWSDT